MNAQDNPVTQFYVTGGTMKLDAVSYVVRQADDEFYELLASGEYCYVLTGRQMGKSSLMARAAARLAGNGIRSAQVDLTLIGTTTSDDSWYYTVAHKILRELGLQTKLDSWWEERRLLTSGQRFSEFLSDVVLNECPGRIVVCLDEIDFTIGMPFCGDLFANIRAAYNARARDSKFDRLSFVLLGVATPTKLISDPTRTPFNIGRGIELADFSPAEAAILASRLSKENARSQDLLEHVLHWTGGHPYLTQVLCRAVAEAEAQSADKSPVELVDGLVNQIFLTSRAVREENNLKFVADMLRRKTADLLGVLTTYRDVVSGNVVLDEPANPVHSALKLCGVVKSESGVLRSRNLIYRKVFSRDWVGGELGRTYAITELGESLSPNLLRRYPFWHPATWGPPATALTVASMVVLILASAFLFRNHFSRATPPPFWEGYYLLPAPVLAWSIVGVCANRPGHHFPRLWSLLLALTSSFLAVYSVVIHRSHQEPIFYGLAVAMWFSILTLTPRLMRVLPDHPILPYIAPLTLLAVLLLLFFYLNKTPGIDKGKPTVPVLAIIPRSGADGVVGKRVSSQCDRNR